MPIIVAIDGPAGSGKSTIASLVSRKLGWDYLNTGTIYRLIGFLAKKNHVSLSSDEELADLITASTKDIHWRSGIFYYKDVDISSELQSEAVGKLASDVAKSQQVRSLLLPLQRDFALSAKKGVIIDGRDIGTVVFPNADLKIFMTADINARASRRFNQIPKKGTASQHSLQHIIAEIQKRDDQDAQRTVAPLQKAADAVEFDTSHLSLEDCIEKVVQLIQTRLSS